MLIPKIIMNGALKIRMSLFKSTLQPLKVGIWIAVSSNRIIGPLFFEDTINSIRYCALVDQFWEQLTPHEKLNCWFQQDNSTSHTSNYTMQYLRQKFGERLISKNLWPPRCPVMAPPGFFLFGHLKQQVFQNHPHTLDELRDSITNAIGSITVETLNNVFRNMRRRVQLCLDHQGGHFEQFL